MEPVNEAAQRLVGRQDRTNQTTARGSLDAAAPVRELEANRWSEDPSTRTASLRRIGVDRVELSAAGLDMSRGGLPPAISEKVVSIRAQIRAGTYDTPEKLDAALDVMLRRAGG